MTTKMISPNLPFLLTLGLIIQFHFISTAMFSTRQTNLGRAKLVLFKGKERFELHGADCPVGTSLVKPERFSCACVSGLWAFYDEWCAPPVKIVGGLNHCFEMPNNWIQQIVLLSNPLKVLDGSLTVFDGDEEYVKAKIYRSTHIPISGTKAIITVNSTWSLKRPDQGGSVCLNSQVGTDTRFTPSGLSPGGNYSFSSVYCHFQDMTNFISRIASFKPGCQEGDTKIQPSKCYEFDETNDESLCFSPRILDNYANYKDIDGIFDPVLMNHTVRAFRKKSKTTTTPAPLFGLMDELDSNNIRLNRGDPELEEDGGNPIPGRSPNNELDLPDTDNLANENGNNDLGGGGFGGSTGGKVETGPGFLTNEQIIAEMKKAAAEGDNWLNPPKSESNPLYLAQVWNYQKQAIQIVLNLKRDEELIENSQIRSLLEASKQIMQATCAELVPREFLDIAMEAFLNVQKKHLQWKPPFVDHADYTRVLASLQNCLQRATKFAFKHSGRCNAKVVGSVFIEGVEKPLKISKELDSKGYEPLTESMWKVLVNAHSYCFEDFSDFYNDHHRYAVIMTPIFTNDIHNIWFGNRTLEVEYSGILGDTNAILKNLDQCTMAARLVSKYPWDLTRPGVSTDFIEAQNRRKKRAAYPRRVPAKVKRFVTSSQYSSSFARNLPMAHAVTTTTTTTPKPEETSSIPTTTEPPNLSPRDKEIWKWKKDRLAMNGLGYCMKKFDEPRTKLEQNCDESETGLARRKRNNDLI